MSATVTYTNAIRLQSVGMVHALPAGELREGDVTVWNYGHTATVKKIAPKGDKMLTMTLQMDRNGLPWNRDFVKTRLVAVAGPTWIGHGRDPKEPLKMDMGKLARSIYGSPGEAKK